LRWALDHGLSTIPKSSSAVRLQENVDVFNFEISSMDLAVMDGFNEGFRMSGEDPMRYF
jgi:diketogulonate reductase-like aldo/keto reductase